jgi:hypothetical protein
MDKNNENIMKVNVVKVLAKAATDDEFYKRLKDDPKGTLNAEGIQGDTFNIPDDLNAIFCILQCLGNVIEKRS